MFSAFFTQALELIGKSLLLSAFFPTLVVTLGVALCVDAQGTFDLIRAWTGEEELSKQATSAVLQLIPVPSRLTPA